MNRSAIIGSFFGVVLTVALFYFVSTSDLVQRTPKNSANVDAGMASVTDSVGTDSPPPVLAGYNPEFRGSQDGIADRAQLKPYMPAEAWDKHFRTAGLPISTRTTVACRDVESEKALSIPTHFATGVENGEINVHFVESRIGRCYGAGTKLAVLVDDLTGGTSIYKILGEATIERIVAAPVRKIPPVFLAEMGLDVRDVSYLANLTVAPRTSMRSVFVIRFSFSKQMPILDETRIPPFVPGAISLKPASIQRYFENFKSPLKPVFIDARDRKNVSSGESYAGAIKAPFISSNPLQLQFQLSLPLSVGAGAKFDLRAIPSDRNTPLVIFGNDNQDAAPLWTIRYLRQLNYRMIFFVDGGLKALGEINPPIRL